MDKESRSLRDGVQCNLLSLLGVDNERLTCFYQGRYFRLTDVHGKVVKGLFA